MLEFEYSVHAQAEDVDFQCFTFQITHNLDWIVRKGSELESNIVSVERIREYSETTTEVRCETFVCLFICFSISLFVIFGSCFSRILFKILSPVRAVKQ